MILKYTFCKIFLSKDGQDTFYTLASDWNILTILTAKWTKCNIFSRCNMNKLLGHLFIGCSAVMSRDFWWFVCLGLSSSKGLFSDNPLTTGLGSDLYKWQLWYFSLLSLPSMEYNQVSTKSLIYSVLPCLRLSQFLNEFPAATSPPLWLRVLTELMKPGLPRRTALVKCLCASHILH